MLPTSSGRLHRIQREDLQPVHSFKLRGAYNKMSSLTRAALQKGVVACRCGQKNGTKLAWRYPAVLSFLFFCFCFVAVMAESGLVPGGHKAKETKNDRKENA